METNKKLSKKAFQTIAGISFMLLFGFALADILALKLIYGNILGDSTGQLILELVLFFVLWIVVVIVFRVNSEMESMANDLRTIREGGISGVMEAAAAHRQQQGELKASTQWFYYAIGMFILGGVFGFITYQMMSKEDIIPIKIAAIALVASVGFVVCLIMALVKKSKGN